MSTKYKTIIFLILFSCILFPAYISRADEEQDKINQLQAQIQQLELQKQQLQGTIAQTAAQANTLKNQIQNLKNQIGSLQVQIQLTGKKIDQTSIQITGVQSNILTTQQKIDYQRATIGQLLLYLQKRDNETLIGILLKSVNLSDYFNEEQYALTVNSQLMGLIDNLKQAENDLGQQKTSLESKKQDLESLKRDQGAQKTSLSSVQTDKNNLLVVTKGQEAAYQKMLVDVQNQQNLFFSQLRELETHVIQGGLYLVHITADSLPKKGTKLFQWPESGYHITQYYGCTNYAQNWGSGLTFSSRACTSPGPYSGAGHNGIDIAAGYATPIHTIADGEIIANGKNDGWGNWVAIKHPGQYNLVSVYTHMSALSFLQVGTKVHVGEVIGYEGKTGNVTGSHLHISIYKDFFTYVSAAKGGQLYFNYFEGSINPSNYL